MPGQEHLGPLTTTFLLSMATPIINLPIERIERHRGEEIEGYADDRQLDLKLVSAIENALGGHSFGKSPFFENGHWGFASVPFREGYNLAAGLPHELVEMLSSEKALQSASSMAASQWVSCLRNSLAHGGVAYLDTNGQPSLDAKAEMLAFVSAKYSEPGTRKPPTHLNALRIREGDFLLFLRAWVDWLQSSGLAEALAA